VTPDTPDNPTAGRGNPPRPEVVAATLAVEKRYGSVVALADATFTVRAGEVRALLGKNGAGKSTLIRMLAGVERPDRGTVEIAGRALGDGGIREAASRGVATVYQELSLVPELSVGENYRLGAWPKRRLGGIDVRRMEREAETALAELGVDVDARTPTALLTLAEQQMVEIARALRAAPRLLILDEPTSALAAAEVAVVLEAVRRIAARGVAVIYVSHRMDEIRQVATTATVMRDGRTIDTVDVGAASTGEIVAMMLGHAAEAAAPERAATRRRAPDEPVLRVRNLSIPPKVADVSFELRGGEVLGIAGLLGAGRTEILRALSGFDRAQAGTIEVGGEVVRHPTPARMLRLGVGMTPEDRKGGGIVPGLGVDENIVMARFPRVGALPTLSWAQARRAAADIAERLSIKAGSLQAPIATLSGGNQQKAVIGRWIHAGSRILLLDEPTRGVDVESKTQIYALVRSLAEQGASVLFVSSELEELPVVCDRVLVLRDGRIAAEHVAPDLRVDALLADTIARPERSAA
jgi:sugar transport system ATP-binding protein